MPDNSFLKDPYTRDTIFSLMAGIKAHNSQMIVGNPGLGKSALVKMLAREMLHADMITIIGSQKEPQDITGFPRMVDKPLTAGNKISITKYAIPEWEFIILTRKVVLLFLDEFSNSTPPVQAAMLQILNEREFPDGMKVPKETVIIGAMNPVETAADGYELGLPVSNRLKFIPWEPSFESWASGMLSNWGHPGDISADEMYWRKKIVAFLNKNRKLVYKLPEKNQKSDPNIVYRLNDSPAENDIFKKAYPTNRSWTNLAKELPYCRYSEGGGKYAPSLISKSANGLVGYEAAKSFMEFLSVSQTNIPTPEQALSHPESIPYKSLDFNELGKLYENCITYAGKNGDRAIKRLFMLTEQYIKNGQSGMYTMQHAPAVKVMRMIPEGKEAVRKLDKMVSSSNVGEILSGWGDRNNDVTSQATDII
jgi:energy-coupling factor transporter ATP-binding protein EcfA2